MVLVSTWMGDCLGIPSAVGFLPPLSFSPWPPCAAGAESPTCPRPFTPHCAQSLRLPSSRRPLQAPASQLLGPRSCSPSPGGWLGPRLLPPCGSQATLHLAYRKPDDLRVSFWGSLGTPEAIQGATLPPAPPRPHSQPKPNPRIGLHTLACTHSHPGKHMHIHTTRCQDRSRAGNPRQGRRRKRERETARGPHKLPNSQPPHPSSSILHIHQVPSQPDHTLALGHTHTHTHPLAWEHGLGLALGSQAEGEL